MFRLILFVSFYTAIGFSSQNYEPDSFKFLIASPRADGYFEKYLLTNPTIRISRSFRESQNNLHIIAKAPNYTIELLYSCDSIRCKRTKFNIYNQISFFKTKTTSLKSLIPKGEN